jgi:flagellar motor switch protein FliM
MQDDILSPKEIEALIRNGEPQHVKGKVVCPYDFRSPELLSKEKFRMFQLLMEEFATKLKSLLSTQFKISFEVEISSIRQSVFKEIQESRENTFMAIFNAPPLEGNALLEIQLPFILFFHQVFLGQELDTFPSARVLTPAEEETGNFLADKFLISFQEAFAKLVQFTFNIVSIEKNPKLLFLASPEEPVIMVTVQFSKQEATCEATFCMPYIVFDSLLPYLDFKKWFFIAQRKKDRETDEKIKHNIESIDVDLVCALGEVDVSLQELLELQVGDYLRLPVAKGGLLNLRVGEWKKFKVKPGKLHRKVAVKIEQVVLEE